MEYFSKLVIDRKKKVLFLNEEALQSLNADAEEAKLLIVAPLKEEGADEKTLYLINITGTNIGSEKEEDKYLLEIFPMDKIRKIKLVKDEDEVSGVIPIDDAAIESFDKVFGATTDTFKLAYQENVVGDMKSVKDIYNISGTYHKITRTSFKKNVIGKSTDVDEVEEIVKLKKEKV